MIDPKEKDLRAHRRNELIYYTVLYFLLIMLFSVFLVAVLSSMLK